MLSVSADDSITGGDESVKESVWTIGTIEQGLDEDSGGILELSEIGQEEFRECMTNEYIRKMWTSPHG